MSKIRFKNIRSSTYEKQHFARIEKYAGKVDFIYNWAADEFAKIASSIKNVDKTKLFSFADYPQTNDRVNKLLQKVYANIHLVIKTGSETEWLSAADKNDALVNIIYKSSQLTKKQLQKYNDRNLDALKAFQDRKTDGTTLSNRVWNYTQSFKSEMELSLDLGLGEGKSAGEISRMLRANLKEPEKLFRRIRDKHGNLVLSKAAQQYNPGQGVYRSSYKNAMRLTRTEPNMAYKASDHARWQKLDFVVGVEIKLSNNPNHCPTCMALAGRYPKDFKFIGWHPQCRCFMISILKTDEEIDADDIRILQGLDPLPDSVNRITSMPPNFNKWIKDNKERAERAKSTPYFIRDNFKDGKISNGLKFDTTKPIIKKADVKPVVPEKANFTPTNIDFYENKLGVKVDKDLFKLLNSPIPLKNELGGAYFHPIKNYVNVPFDKRRLDSKWYSEAVVYHEYGHAIDWQHNIKTMPELKNVMDRYRNAFSKSNNAQYKSIDSTLQDLGFDSFVKKDYDKMNKVGAAHDTLMALDKRFGAGHSKEYFSRPGMPEAEFIAHMFENKFAGNEIFKQVMPDLYDDMIKTLDTIISKITQ
ncbi:hypothetical protein [Pedobacter panaciterrae]